LRRIVSDVLLVACRGKSRFAGIFIRGRHREGNKK
jgi:hypothetical protein